MIKNENLLKPNVNIEHQKDLIYERKEIKELKRGFLKYFSGKDSGWLHLLSGSSGSGKTLSVRYALYSIMKKHPEFSDNFIYVDGKSIRTPLSVYKYILNQLGGCSEAINTNDLSTLIIKIQDKLNEKKSKCLIVIDEVDKIFRNSRESPRYLFLHSLNRLEVVEPLYLFMITNDFNLRKNFGSELSAGMIQTIFKAYTAPDIFEILKLRAEYCLDKKLFNYDDLYLIAKETYQNPVGGDKANIRHALIILKKAADLAEDKNKTIKDTLSQAICEIRVDDLVALLSKYNFHCLKLIRAFALLKKEKNEGLSQFTTHIDITFTVIRDKFFELCEMDKVKKITDRQLYRYFMLLENEFLISKINKGVYCFNEDAEEILFALDKLE